MAPKKRKASAIESEEGSEEIAWIKKQKLPSGSSPVLWDSKYASSSDEEFEGFFDSSNLFLSDVHKSTSNADVLGFFQDFKCDVVSRDVQKDKKLSFVVRFSSHELAMAALEKYKDVKLEGRTISLTRSADSRYKTFRIKGFKNTLAPAIKLQQVKDIYGRFGRILHFLFPTEEKDFGYLYMHLAPRSNVKDVLSMRKTLQAEECQMKGKVSKSLSSNWTTIG